MESCCRFDSSAFGCRDLGRHMDWYGWRIDPSGRFSKDVVHTIQFSADGFGRHGPGRRRKRHCMDCKRCRWNVDVRWIPVDSNDNRFRVTRQPNRRFRHGAFGIMDGGDERNRLLSSRTAFSQTSPSFRVAYVSFHRCHRIVRRNNLDWDEGRRNHPNQGFRVDTIQRPKQSAPIQYCL